MRDRVGRLMIVGVAVGLTALHFTGSDAQLLDDRTFLADAARRELGWRALGELAAKRGSSSVQRLGESMASASEARLAGIRDVAEDLDVALPRQAAPRYLRVQFDLLRFQDRAFDAQLLAWLADDILSVIDTYTRYAFAAENEDVRLLASNHAVQLRARLGEIDRLLQAMRGDSP